MYGKCLETRSRRGVRWRRYRAPEGHLITTYEIPCSVVDGLTTWARMAARLEGWYRGQARLALRAAILARLADGDKPLAIAYELNVSTRWVERLRASNGNVPTTVSQGSGTAPTGTASGVQSDPDT